MQEKFVLMVYAPRSGSTFLAKELTNNYDIVFAPESNFIPRLLNRYEFVNRHNLDECIDILFKEDKFNDLGISIEDINNILQANYRIGIRDFIGTMLDIYASKNGNPGTVGIKKGSYLSHVAVIDHYFPDLKYIGLIRDGRAVYASQKRNIQTSTGQPFETDAKAAAEKWVSAVQRIRLLEADKNAIVVRYEHVIEDVSGWLRKIADFLEVPSLAFSQDRYKLPPRYTVLHKNINKRALDERVTAWKDTLSDSEISEFERVAYKTLRQEGYYTIT